MLVIGYGNPGRLDDGLGPRLAEALEPLGSDRISIDSDYQLSVEDAEAVARHDLVVFVDAAVTGPEPFYVSEVVPTGTLGYTSHGLEPGDVLGLAHGLFGSTARGFVLGIRGYAFDDFGEGLSERAEQNLAKARAYLETTLGSTEVLSALGSAAAPSTPNP